MNPPSSIRIRKMRVRVPGDSEEIGNALAQELSQRLGTLAVNGRSAKIGAIGLRIQNKPGLDAAALANSITTAISARLARNNSNSHA